VFSWESRRTRRSGRDRRRPDIAAIVEALEGRQLLAYNAIGFSLPDFTVSGFAAPVASWGNAMAVTVNVSNIGANTMLDPLSLAPGSTGPADAATTVAVFASKTPRTIKGGFLLGSIDVPTLAGNSSTQLTQTFTLPEQPAGFPGDGKKIYLTFIVNPTNTVLESDTTNDISKPVPVMIEAPLPELAAVGLDVPPTMQPGDTIQPNIRVANFGTVDTALQGNVQVALVASTTPTFTSGSSIVALYNVSSIPAQSLVPSQGAIFADANLQTTENIVTIAGNPVTLPASPAKYYLGVVVDPFNQIKELKKVPQHTKPQNVFELALVVGPPIKGLPAAGVNVAGGVANVPLFPNPVGGNPVGGLPNGGGFPVPYPPVPLSSVASASVTATSTVTASAATSTTARMTAAQRRQAVLNLLHGSSSTSVGATANASTLRTLAAAMKLRSQTKV
jgi:hypothetical protein